MVIALARHGDSKINTALAGLRCITSLTLRNPDCARGAENEMFFFIITRILVKIAFVHILESFPAIFCSFFL